MGHGPRHLSQTTSIASGQEHPQKVGRLGTADRPGPSVTPPALHGSEVSQGLTVRPSPGASASSWLRE